MCDPRSMGKTTLAICVMAAIPVSVLLAQDKPKPSQQSVERPPLSLSEKQLTPPPVMRICDAAVQGWCWTYTKNADHYDGANSRGGSRRMSVERFTAESVVMRVTQSDRPGFSALNTGKISSNGESLAGEWSDSTGNGGHIVAYWGKTLAAHPTVNPPNNAAALAFFVQMLLGAFTDDAQSSSDGDKERQQLNMSACGNKYMSPAACGH
jgi:hypothetical protein